MPAARLRFAIGRVQALGGLLASMPRRLPVCHAASRDIQTTLCVSASMHALSTRVCAKRSLQFLYKSPTHTGSGASMRSAMHQETTSSKRLELATGVSLALR
jgi:hypothetical protein